MKLIMVHKILIVMSLLLAIALVPWAANLFMETGNKAGAYLAVGSGLMAASLAVYLRYFIRKNNRAG